MATGRGKVGRQLCRIGQHEIPGVIPHGRRLLGGGQDFLRRVEEGRQWIDPLVSGRRACEIALGDSGVEDLAVGINGHLARPRGSDGKLGRLHPAVEQQQIVALEQGWVVDRPIGFRRYTSAM